MEEKVTIILGDNAKKYVTGIPREELPSIISDLLERALSEEVRGCDTTTSNDNKEISGDMIIELKNLIEYFKKVNVSTNYTKKSIDVDSIKNIESKSIDYKDTNNDENEEDSGDDPISSLFDLLK